MEIDLDKHAVLNGIPPSNAAYVRGGKLAEGTVAKMVELGMEYIEKGYVGVMVLYDHGTLQSADIQALAAQVTAKREP